jgi:hypothetical protein
MDVEVDEVGGHGPESLPLDGTGRLRGDVEDDAIDPLDLVDDAGCHDP